MDCYLQNVLFFERGNHANRNSNIVIKIKLQ
jgi:hypothetical protein